jgi:hypothetical protein
MTFARYATNPLNGAIAACLVFASLSSGPAAAQTVTAPATTATCLENQGTGEFACGHNSVTAGPSATAVGNDAIANAIGATAIGQNVNGALTAGLFSTAVGVNTAATGSQSTAIGDGSGPGSLTATGNGSVAIGKNATSGGTIINGFTNSGTIAIGSGASAGATAAGQTDAIAIGTGANANAASAIAIGQGSTASFANSTAIGVGATSTRANQVVVGTATNTYTLPGVTSAASLAAQTGAVSFVTSDANGNLATTSLNPAGVASLQNNVTILQGNVAVLQQQMRQSFEGTAMAIAMGGSSLPGDKRFAISTNFGTFRGESAVGLLAQARVSDNIVLNGGISSGFAQGGVGGRVGATYAW